MNYIVVNKRGLNVRSQMTTTNQANIQRTLSFGTGLVVHEVYHIQGMSGLQTWGRITENPGGQQQEYVCIKIGEMIFAQEEQANEDVDTATDWMHEIDAWARTKGYTGPRP